MVQFIYVLCLLFKAFNHLIIDFSNFFFCVKILFCFFAIHKC
jgi:hypothetical protein